MLTTLRDNEGNIQAACEWWCVDENGTWTPKGPYVWVNQLEHSPGVDGEYLIKEIVAQVAWLAPWAKGAYWERRDKKDGRIHGFTRARLTRLLKEVRV